MVGKFTIFMSSILAMPVVAQVDPATAVDKLAVGTAQFVLAAIAVAEAIAIGYMFFTQRKDIQRERAEMKEQLNASVGLTAKVTAALADNTSALQHHSIATHRHSDAVESFQRSVEKVDETLISFREVIRKCEGK